MEEVDEMIDGADIDSDGKISYEEFVKMVVIGINDFSNLQYVLAKRQAKKASLKIVREVLQSYDLDGTGAITVDELYEGLSTNIGDDILLVEEIIENVDKDDDGNINHNEFLNMVAVVWGKENQFVTGDGRFLTKNQVDEFRMAFDLFDLNKDDRITVE